MGEDVAEVVPASAGGAASARRRHRPAARFLRRMPNCLLAQGVGRTSRQDSPLLRFRRTFPRDEKPFGKTGRMELISRLTPSVALEAGLGATCLLDKTGMRFTQDLPLLPHFQGFRWRGARRQDGDVAAHGKTRPLLPLWRRVLATRDLPTRPNDRDALQDSTVLPHWQRVLPVPSPSTRPQRRPGRRLCPRNRGLRPAFPCSRRAPFRVRWRSADGPACPLAPSGSTAPSARKSTHQDGALVASCGRVTVAWVSRQDRRAGWGDGRGPRIVAVARPFLAGEERLAETAGATPTVRSGYWRSPVELRPTMRRRPPCRDRERRAPTVRSAHWCASVERNRPRSDVARRPGS
jgi:hypothetical protein